MPKYLAKISLLVKGDSFVISYPDLVAVVNNYRNARFFENFKYETV